MSFSASRRSLAWALIGLLNLCPACGDESHATPLVVSWRFVDDRPCDLAGVSEVFVSVAEEEPTRFRCPDGASPGGLQDLSVPSRPANLKAEGRSITGAVLYRGEAEVTSDQEALEFTLRFVGGESPPR